MDQPQNTHDLSDEEAQALVGEVRAAIAQGRDRAANKAMNALRDECLRRLRRIVWEGYPNRGEDIIIDALDHIVLAICQPGSRSGEALRTKFAATVFRHALSAIGRNKKLRTRNVQYEVGASGEIMPPSGVTFAPHATADRSTMAEIEEREAIAWVEAQIAAIEDDATRLAIRLYMDEMNIEKGNETIAKAIGCDPKTVRQKIKRARDLLKAKLKREGWL